MAFLACDGGVATPNLGSYSGRMYQAWYLAGHVAGATTCTARVGVVAGLPTPQTVRAINAFTLGVQARRPEAQVEVAWTGTWHDPEGETAHTLALIERGADVVAAHTERSTPVSAAAGQTTACEGASQAVWSIGFADPDVCTAAPDSCLTAPVGAWGPLYARLVADIRDGRWDPATPVWEPIQAESADSVVDLAPLHPSVDAAVRGELEALRTELAREDFHHLPFEGPLADASGTVRLPAGSALSDTELQRMCWLVDGVVQVDPSTGLEMPAEVPPGCTGDD